VNGITVALLVTAGLAVLAFPKRWALVGLLAGTCYVTRAQSIELGSLTFTVVRILIAVGVFRVLLRSEWKGIRFRGLDWLIVSWGLWMLISVYFHKAPSDQVVERLGFVFDAWGVYFLVRSLCRSWEQSADLCRLAGIVLTPIAAEMVVEKMTAHNLFAFFGGVAEVPYIRHGHVRAQGPFAHAILAGTIGAVCLPLVISAWNRHRKAAVIGVLTCTTMVFASTSSGPILSAAAGVGALALWRYRNWTGPIRWAAVFGYLALDAVMKDPAYYILARIDLAGGSTGWHRARLIESSINHISEWWLFGTDYTRHWMASGVSWSPDHTDITNYYLYMGILGGFPLMLLFICLGIRGFTIVRRGLRNSPAQSDFALWALGSALFVHAVTCISVAYFDQSVVFLFLTVGLLGAAENYVPVAVGISRQPALQPAVRRPTWSARAHSRSQTGAGRPATEPAVGSGRWIRSPYSDGTRPTRQGTARRRLPH
jgi:hypothetical protein